MFIHSISRICYLVCCRPKNLDGNVDIKISTPVNGLPSLVVMATTCLENQEMSELTKSLMCWRKLRESCLLLLHVRGYTSKAVDGHIVKGKGSLLVHGQVTIIFVVSVCLCVCLFVQSFSQPSLIRFRLN